MGNINVLTLEVSNKIAAGEVVERPASVVKELVENSIDAGADSVTVEIRRGGNTYIRVSDNGSGMGAEDAKLCFLRHATSKIKTDKDLQAIYTLGFRGEALSSIGAVAKVDLYTKLKSKSMGVHFTCNGGEISDCSEEGMQQGTTFVVRELFYNTPARMKFLKKDSTEAGHIADIMTRFILAHPEISFKLISDGREKLFSPGDNNLVNAVYTVYGKDYAAAALSVRYENEGVKLVGVAGKGNICRPNRGYESFFVNGRYVKSPLMMKAAEEAYKNQIMIGKFPMVVLNLELNPEQVDINVHPTKLEVKFSQERLIYETVYHGVKNALYKEANVPEFSLPEKKVTERVKNPFSPKTKQTYRSPYNYNEMFGRFGDDEDEVKDGEAQKAANVETVEPKIEEAANPQYSESAKPKNEEIINPQDSKTASFENNGAANAEKQTKAAQKSREDEYKVQGEQLAYKIEQQPPKVPPPEKKSLFSMDKYVTKKMKRAIEYSAKPIQSDGARLVTEEQLAKIRDYPGLQPPKSALEVELLRKAAFGENTSLHSEMPTPPAIISETEEEQEGNFRIVGQLFETYIIVEKDGEMLIFDQHAAHERLNYEKLKKQAENDAVTSQLLLEAVVVNLTAPEMNIYRDNSEFFEKLGFDISEFGDNTLMINAAPSELTGDEAESLIVEILTQISESKHELITEKFQRALYTAACRQSVKANDKLSEKDMEWLVSSVLSLENINTCPHGRPIMIKMTKKELEKQFKRIV